MAFDIIFISLLLSGIGAGIVCGNTDALSSALIEGAGNAAALCFELAGPVCLWSGVMEVMERAGLLGHLTRLLRRPLLLLLPDLGGEASGSVCLNIAANLLGLGNAATPAGVRASSLISSSRDLGAFVLMNTCSLQLFPATVGALAASLGSEAPFAILPAVWLSSLCSLTAALLCAALIGEKR